MAKADDPVDPDENLSLHLRKGRFLFRTFVIPVHHSRLLNSFRLAQQLKSRIALRVPDHDGDPWIQLQIREGGGTEPFRDGNARVSFGLYPARCGYVRKPFIVCCGYESHPNTATKADSPFKDLRFHI
jgi:hypothetical protein